MIKLYRGAKEREYDTLADLLMLLMYSGARLSEICNLKVADIADDHFSIADAKTQAGIRTIPIHHEVRQLIARLIEPEPLCHDEQGIQ